VRIDCSCGARIKDQTDELPHKGHMIPDQEWFAVFDALDAQVIAPLHEGGLDQKAAYPLARHLISRSAWLMYQCRECGRLYIYNRDGKELNCFVPESERTSREVLRSRPNVD